MSFFPTALNGLSPTHRSPKDFSATFTTNVTITIAGAPYTVADTNCTVAYIYYKPSGGQWQEPLINGLNGVSIVSLANVLTIDGAGTPFASGDQYLIGLIEQEKEHIAVNNAKQVLPLELDSTKFTTPEHLIDKTNVAAATYRVSFSGIDFRHEFIHMNCSGGVIMTLWATADDTADTTADTGWVEITNGVMGIATITDSEGIGVIDTAWKPLKFMVKYVTSDATNAIDAWVIRYN
jgi:hypothetical protein